MKNKKNEKDKVNEIEEIESSPPPKGICDVNSVFKSNGIHYIHDYHVPSNLDLEGLLLQCAEFKDIRLRSESPRNWLKELRIRKLYFIISFIQIAYIRKTRKLNTFVNICSLVLKDIVGTRYYPFALRILVEIGILEENRRYSTGLFTKSYRFTEKYRNKEIQVVSFKLGKPPKQPKDTSILDDEVKMFIHRNISKLSFDHSAYRIAKKRLHLNYEREIRIDIDAARLQTGRIGLTGGKTQRRLYHVVNEAPREFRQFLRLNGEKLLEGDIKSAHPCFLLILYDDPNSEEALKYKEALHGDIYCLLADGKVTRGRAKKEFQYFENGWLEEPYQIAEAFQKHFPILSGRITNFAESLSARMQDLESEIMNYCVGRKCMEYDIFFVSIHDGFLCLERDFELISGFVKDEIFERFSFHCDMKVK